ncbi:2Fe-2S iron-sulfur cluster-binding protein [Ramlibacter albus]|uniref:2Fe-2S iron-sulfur cluster binding domain-containing protein n=1 Tax=Ramlibacter albus TaxID=2079448 RepID=A0A923MDF2_9BURK|nr:2Fe-2S iron-sulfur cluster-binding protein [Ramlibacter albus]MBC5767398.1 2Fe-2S iron-sulfur cluster binding domain-containing protein [Ramlibacter albus]
MADDEVVGRGEFEVRIEPQGLVFRAASGQPVLVSAYAAGIVMPSSCRNGTCRACMRRLRAGTVTYRIEWPGLLAEEKDEGWILPCVAYPLSDLVLDGTGL